MSDYISREAAMRVIDELYVKRPLDSDRFVLTGVGARLEELPAADVRPVVRGKWRLYSPLTDTYECDKCGYQVIDESFRTNFCPNCGADMREES